MTGAEKGEIPALIPGDASHVSQTAGIQIVAPIVQTQNQGKRCNGCFDFEKVFYAVLSFSSSTRGSFFNI